MDYTTITITSLLLLLGWNSDSKLESTKGRPSTVSLTNDRTFREPIGWMTTFFMGAFHVGAVIALFMFTWKALAIALFLWWVSGSLGIGMGYHRLLTHRGYTTPKWLEYFLTVCATLALEGGPIFWVATHRIHHQFSDRDGDPHSPRDGKWWAHIGWLLVGKSMHHDTSTLSRYVPDLAKDKFHVWITKYHYVPIIVTAALLYAFGTAFGGGVDAGV